MNEKDYQVKLGEILVKCWDDNDFKESFIKDPKKYFKEANIDVPDEKNIKVIEAEKNVRYIVLPYDDAKSVVETVSKQLMQAVSQKNTLVTEGAELRIVQNTKDTSYCIIPKKPDDSSNCMLCNGSEGSEDTVVVSNNVIIAPNIVGPVVIYDPGPVILNIDPGPIIQPFAVIYVI